MVLLPSLATSCCLLCWSADVGPPKWSPGHQEAIADGSTSATNTT